MSDIISRCCIVSGRVQGVWFRYSTRTRALEYGLSGEARNLSDGRVQVIMHGRTEDVKRLITWLNDGPELARVTDVVCEAYAGNVSDGFSIG